jgi:hypothetical protein
MKMNSMFSYAGIGLGEANYREKDYASALTSFRRGYNRQGYSDAFWELRSDWLKDNTGLIIVGLFALVVIWNAVRITDRRFGVLAPLRKVTAPVKKIKLLSQTMFTFRNIKNPSDVAYGIKHEGRAGYLSSFILFVVFYLLFVLEKYGAGFLFKTVEDGYYDMVGDAGTVIAAFGLPVICCYLVCTINDGEASFKELLCGVIYAFAPVFLLKPLGIVLTNVLTLNEAFFISLTSFIAYAWTALLVFLAIKNLNDYTFGKTIRIIFLTLFVTLITALLIFIIYVLVMQVVDFVSSVAGEAVYKWAG